MKTSLSDHCILTINSFIPVVVNHSTSEINPPSSVMESLNFNKCDWELLITSLCDIDWSVLLADLSAIDCFNTFMTTVSIICQNVVPQHRAKTTHISKHHRERKTLMKKRAKLKKRLKSCNRPEIIQNLISSIESDILCSHKNERLHEEELAVSRIKTDSNFFFRFAKKFSITKQDIGPFYDGAGDLITDKSEISQLLLEQFSSVFSTPSTDEKVTDPDSFFTYNIDGKPLLTDIIIDDEHIVSAVKEMSVSSSAGPDGLPSSFLKNCLPVLIKPLKILLRKSLDSGDIPAIFKRAAIVPIFKGGDRTCPANYRPISLTPVLMKLFERIIRKQVISFLVVNKLLNPSQHGFRENRSCLSALLDVYDNLLFMLAENPCIIDMIYLDFSKAFDKVDFGILFHKMKDMGITGKLGIWFYHFLVNRTQFVRLPGGSSTDSHVISGVPQGTVLGPLLFLILMSDIDEGIVNSKIISFADDTRLYNSVSEVEDCDVLQSDLNTIYKWADANNMAFNPNKFKYVCFTPSESVSHSNVYLCPKMNLIDKVENIKDLGITMSSNCNFNQHINNVYKQCSRLSGWILTTFISRDSLTLLTLFKCIVLSRLDYGSQLWSPHQIKSINKIEQVQRSFTRFITGMRPLSYDERLKSLHLYSVQRRFERYIIIYIWKILESIVPNLSQPITCYFSDRRGRLCHLKHVCAGRLGTLSYNSFRWKAVRLFNCLPQHVRNVSSCSTIIFKKKLDQFLCNLDDKPCTPHFDNSVVHVTKCDTNFVSC